MVTKPRNRAFNADSAFARKQLRWDRKLRGTVCAVMMTFGATASLACGFHTYLPEKTAVDWIINSDHLIVARNSPENEFQFEVLQTLRGTAPSVKITHLVDTRTRTRFAANPQDASLFAFDQDAQDWKFVAYLTPDYRNVVDEVLARAPNWQDTYDPDRFQFFEALQDHPDEVLRMLALREIDQAPYGLLRTMDVRIPTDDLLAELWSLNGYPYQPIRVLLLGLTDDQEARDELYDFIDRVASWNWANNLGAYATALVEIDGGVGVEVLEEKFLSDTSQPLDKLEQVVEALAIHNDIGTPDLRSVISASIARLVALRPETAPLVARQFGNRQDWSQALALESVVRERALSNGQDILQVAVYVAQGRNAALQSTLKIED
ncbi:hypothetical protein [Tateyamaria pelophila]|uniref:hypothetical protein n=1 Tax=Tateyamaria pelophila TaxID=328415 RepID=UPI001CBF7D00|nr:hypothetical protein [Tateyamaria pelophila]